MPIINVTNHKNSRKMKKAKAKTEKEQNQVGSTILLYI